MPLNANARQDLNLGHIAHLVDFRFAVATVL